MSRPLMSRTWSAGSLDVGSRHLIKVKQELKVPRAEMEKDLKAGIDRANVLRGNHWSVSAGKGA